MNDLKGRRIVWIVGAVCLVLAVLVAALVFGGRKDQIFDTSFSREIKVENGVAVPASFTCAASIPKDGTYRLELEWTGAAGLCTGARLLDADGNVLFGVTGDSLSAESRKLHLDAGAYVLEFVPLTNAEAFTGFVRPFLDEEGLKETDDGRLVSDYKGTITDINDYAFAESGTWRNEYAYTIEKTGLVGHKTAKAAGILVGAFIGLTLAAVILLLTKKDRSIRAKYDERQQLARGKAYKYGFWTAFGYFGLWILLDIAEIRVPAEDCVTAFLGMLLTGLVFVSSCISSDAYFSLNENRKAISIAMLLLGLANCGFGAINLLRGEAIVDGILTFRSINLLCGIFLLCIGAVLLARRLRGDREEDAE